MQIYLIWWSHLLHLVLECQVPEKLVKLDFWPPDMHQLPDIANIGANKPDNLWVTTWLQKKQINNVPILHIYPHMPQTNHLSFQPIPRVTDCPTSAETVHDIMNFSTSTLETVGIMFKMKKTPKKKMTWKWMMRIKVFVLIKLPFTRLLHTAMVYCLISTNFSCSLLIR